jgi:hypothetical protein
MSQPARRRRIVGVRALIFCLVALLPLHASVIGVSQPAESLTVARVMTLSPAQRGPWLAYLKRSDAQKAADKRVLAEERAAMKETPPLPIQGSSARSVPLHRDAAFYKSDEARHIGDVILSFQTSAGGWSKNLDMSGPARLKGQSYATSNLAPVESGAGDFDEPQDPNWHYIGTLDNDATNTQLHFLAELSAANPGMKAMRIEQAFCVASSTCCMRSSRTADGRRCGRWRVATMTQSHSTTMP